MGFFVCFLESALCLAASYWVAAASHRDRSTSHRWLVAWLIALAILYAVMQALGYASMLTAVALGVGVPVVCALLTLLASRRLPSRELMNVLREDRGAVARLFAELRARPDVLLLLVPAGALVMLEQLARVWALRSWSWDAVWYHHPMTSYAIQDASLIHRVADIRNIIEGYPNGVELVGVWLCIFPRSDVFEDAIQLPFVPLGVLLTYVWTRRVGVRRATALGLAAGWLLLPPVFLLLATGYNDVACGVVLACGVFFLSEEDDGARSLVLTTLALSIYLASKYSAVLHIALLGPFICARLVLACWRARGQPALLAGSFALGLVVVFFVGLPNYLDNWFAHANPLWPMSVDVPLAHVTLPGTEDVRAVYATHGTFFRGEGAFAHMLTAWWKPATFFRPDTNEGGWGPAGRWLLIPAIVLVSADLLRGRRTREASSIVVLSVIAVMGPITYIPRFTSGMVFAMFASMAFFLTTTGRRVAWLASVALIVLLVRGYLEVPGHAIQPEWSRVVRLLGASELERATTPLVDYHWPTELMLAKEALPPGSVVVYDEGVMFPQEVFTHDYHTVVRYVPSDADPDAFIARIRELGARWVIVRGRAAIDRGLLALGAQKRFDIAGGLRVYELPAGSPASR